MVTVGKGKDSFVDQIFLAFFPTTTSYFACRIQRQAQRLQTTNDFADKVNSELVYCVTMFFPNYFDTNYLLQVLKC